MKKSLKLSGPISPGRRDFIINSAAVLGGTLLSTGFPIRASGYVTGGDAIKIALIGCGARGAGAAVNALRADKNVELVAMADAFRDKLDETFNNLTKIEDIKEIGRASCR